tara:strand:- start:3898 stop:4626 length:729 start_codon:yes stop_codon:yes gene_type:complete
MKTISPYDQVISRKRKWTPLAVQAGKLVEGSEDAIKRALGLRHLELPVREFLQQGLDRELPKTPGLREALLSNQLDEERHDQALNYVVAAHGSEQKYEDESKHILKAWLDAPEHPILKAAILERSVFFVILPFFRYNGDFGIKTTASDISRDEQCHVAIHTMVCSELGLQSTPSLNRLRRATVAWVMDAIGTNENKYLDKDFWMKQSDSLYARGKAPGLKDTQRARMPAFFEAPNTDLPQYG